MKGRRGEGTKGRRDEGAKGRRDEGAKGRRDEKKWYAIKQPKGDKANRWINQLIINCTNRLNKKREIKKQHTCHLNRYAKRWNIYSPSSSVKHLTILLKFPGPFVLKVVTLMTYSINFFNGFKVAFKILLYVWKMLHSSDARRRGLKCNS